MGDKVEIYVTKYALTQGIKYIAAEYCGKGMMVFKPTHGLVQYFHWEGKDWHLTRADAIKRAALMREKKIAFLKKQIEKLEAMTW